MRSDYCCKIENEIKGGEAGDLGGEVEESMRLRSKIRSKIRSQEVRGAMVGIG